MVSLAQSVAIALYIVGVHGAPPSNLPIDKTIASGDDAVLDNKVRTGQVELKYGPEVGVDHKAMGQFKHGFDDTEFLDWNTPLRRQLVKVSCYFAQGRPFAGLREYYATGTRAPWKITKYRGYTPSSPFINLHDQSYTLAPGEHWSHITYKRWGRKITGVQFTTSTGKSFSCGDWDHTVNCLERDGCKGGKLEAPAGTKIVGLYGDSNGDRGRDAQGIRGLGLITA